MRMPSQAQYEQAVASRDQAKVNLERTEIRFSGERVGDQSIGAAR